MTFDTPSRLRRLNVREISVVGAPAVPGALIGLAKAGELLAVVMAKAAAHVSAGEVAEAVRLAKMRTPAPPAFWQEHLDALAKAHIGPGIPPSMAMNLALNTTDGRELLAALHRAGVP